jgi:prepilin-type N-terminal cleavage/methylation domain-containing protein
VVDQLGSGTDRKNLIEQGFTLVELLIVIVILGILAGIVVFAVGNLTNNATKNACGTEAKTFFTAVQAYNVASPANNPAAINTATDAAGSAGLVAQLNGGATSGSLVAPGTKTKYSVASANYQAAGQDWYYNAAANPTFAQGTGCAS